MKNIYLGAFAVATMLLAMASCKKETQTPLEPGSATIMGLVEANLNEADDTLSDGSAIANNGKDWELAPSGTMLTFSIDSRDLDPSPQGGFTYKELLYTAQVGADGMYSVTVPAYERPINVDVMFNDFAADVTEWGEDPGDTLLNGAPATVQKRYSFSKSSESVSVYDKAVIVLDARYAKN